MHLYDAATHRLLRSYDAGRPAEDGQGFLIGAFSPDSSQLAVILTSVESTEPVRLLDPDTMQPTAVKLASLGGKPVTGVDVQFSADGRYLAATVHTVHYLEQSPSETTGYAVVWDLRSPSSPPERVQTGHYLQGMALSPDGRTLYTNRPLTAYDVATGRQIWRRNDVNAFLTLDVNAEGTRLALDDRGVSETGKDALLVDAEDGHTVARLLGHQDVVRDIRFSPDGTLVGSVSNDGELIVWDGTTGELLERWDTFAPWGVGFGPDNDLVHGGGADSMLRTWDLSVEDTYLQQTTQVRDAETFAQAHISPDGQQVAYRWRDDQDKGWVRFVDTATGETTPATRLPAVDATGESWAWGAWHPQGGQYVGFACGGFPCAAPGTVTVLDSATSQALRDEQDIVDGNGDILDLGYVDGGRSLLVVLDGRTLIVVDAETLQPRGEPFAVPANCCTTPIGDGSTAMVYDGAGDGASAHWRVIDVSTGAVRREGDVDFIPFTSVASSDGSTVAVAGFSGEIVTIDVSTGTERGDPSVPVPRCGGSTTPTTASCWSPAPSTGGSACGTPRRWTCWAP